MRRYKGPLELAFCVLVLFAAAFAVLWPAFVHDQLPWAADPLFALQPWEQAQGAMEQSAIADSSTFVIRYFPWYRFLSESAENGESILWYPLENGGMPFLAMWQTRCLSLFTVAVYVLPLFDALRISALLKIFAAGITAYWAARRFGLLRANALVAALTFELSAATVLWVGAPAGDAVVALPLLAGATIPPLRTWRSTIIAPVSIALMVFGGSPELAVIAVIFCVMASLLIYGWRTGARYSAATLIFAVYGIVLAAAQILPAAELALRLETAPAASRWTPSVWHVFSLFVPPDVFADHAPSSGNRIANLWYVGGAGGLLLLLWVAMRKSLSDARRRRYEAIVLAGLLIVAVGMVFILLGPFGVWTQGFEAAHFFAPLIWALGVLFGGALQEWVIFDPEQCRKTLRRGLRALPVFGMLVAAATGAAYLRLNEHETVWRIATPALLGLGVCLLIGWTLLKPWPRLAGYGGAALLAVNQFTAIAPQVIFSNSEDFFPQTAFVESLESRGGRVSGSEQLERWPLAGNGIAQFYGTSGYRLERQAAFIDRVHEDPLLHRRTGSPVLLLTKQDIQGSYASVRPMLRVENVFASGAVLFEDLATDSRVRMVYDVRPVAVPAFDAIRSDAPPIVERPEPLEVAAGPDGQAAITNDAHNGRLTVQVSETRAGLLVLADAYYPGWVAEADGAPARIVAVDGMFRGVALEAGSHEVVFRYRPLSFWSGVTISIGALLALIPLALWRRNSEIARTAL